VQRRAAQHEVGARRADLRAVEERAHVVRLGVAPACPQTVHHGLEAHAMALEAVGPWGPARLRRVRAACILRVMLVVPPARWRARCAAAVLAALLGTLCLAGVAQAAMPHHAEACGAQFCDAAAGCPIAAPDPVVLPLTAVPATAGLAPPARLLAGTPPEAPGLSPPHPAGAVRLRSPPSA
jgi:hypothetical protein